MTRTMSKSQKLVHSIAAHPGYVIFLSLALVAIVSVVLGMFGTQEAAATGGLCSSCIPHLTIGNLDISNILPSIVGIR